MILCEVEIMVMKDSTTQAIRLHALLKGLGEDQTTSTIMHTGSKVAHVTLISEIVLKELKHVVVACQWVHEQLANVIISMCAHTSKKQIPSPSHYW